MSTLSETLSSRTQIEADLHHLRQRLAEAWWDEDPLEKIQELEREIDIREEELTRP